MNVKYATVNNRQFMGRHADGSYEIEWVNELWRGWCMAVTTLGSVK